MTDSKEARDRITELSLDTGDIVLKALSDSEILNEIPILSSIYKLGKVVLSIPDIFFLRKFERFMQPFNQKTTHDEQLKFAEELKRDPKRLERFYENLLLRVERMDDITKPEILGKIYACHVSRKIREEELQDLCHSLNNSKLIDLIEFSRSFWLKSYKFGVPEISRKTSRNLVSSGLVTFDIHEAGQKLIFGISDPIPKFPSSFIESKESPYTISFSITELGYLYAYVSEDLDSYFQIKDDNSINSYESLYEFTTTQDLSLRRAIQEKWNLAK